MNLAIYNEDMVKQEVMVERDEIAVAEVDEQLSEPPCFRDCDVLKSNLQEGLNMFSESSQLGRAHVGQYKDDDQFPSQRTDEASYSKDLDTTVQLDERLKKQNIFAECTRKQGKQNVCSTCEEIRGEVRQPTESFKTDCYKHNLRRKTRQLPPLSDEECLADVELGLKEEIKSSSIPKSTAKSKSHSRQAIRNYWRHHIRDCLDDDIQSQALLDDEENEDTFCGEGVEGIRDIKNHQFSSVLMQQPGQEEYIAPSNEDLLHWPELTSSAMNGHPKVNGHSTFPKNLKDPSELCRPLQWNRTCVKCENVESPVNVTLPKYVTLESSLTMVWLEISWDELDIKEQIGAGSFGTIYSVEWHQYVVAVKVLVDQDYHGYQHLETFIMLEVASKVLIWEDRQLTRPPPEPPPQTHLWTVLLHLAFCSPETFMIIKSNRWRGSTKGMETFHHTDGEHSRIHNWLRGWEGGSSRGCGGCGCC